MCDIPIWERRVLLEQLARHEKWAGAGTAGPRDVDDEPGWLADLPVNG